MNTELGAKAETDQQKLLPKNLKVSLFGKKRGMCKKRKQFCIYFRKFCRNNDQKLPSVL